MTDPYRTTETPTHCENCVKQQKLFDKTVDAVKKLRKYQDADTAQCPFCGASLYKKGESVWIKRSHWDDIFCFESPKRFLSFFKRNSPCPLVPHMHRHCSYCGGKWFEDTWENK